MELTGHSYFPNLISAPFHAGLTAAFIFARWRASLQRRRPGRAAPPARQDEAGGDGGAIRVPTAATGAARTLASDPLTDLKTAVRILPRIWGIYGELAVRSPAFQAFGVTFPFPGLDPRIAKKGARQSRHSESDAFSAAGPLL
jgi:hypothetical protein